MVSGGRNACLSGELGDGPAAAGRLQRPGPSAAPCRHILTPPALPTLCYTLERLPSLAMSTNLHENEEYEVDEKDAKGFAGVVTQPAAGDSREPESLRDVSEADLKVMDRKLTRKMVSRLGLLKSRPTGTDTTSRT